MQVAPPSDYVNLLASSNTTIPNNWEKPEEFKNSPIYYKAVEHCDCAIIDQIELNPGNHTLKYIVDSVGGESSINAADKGWKFIRLRNISLRSNKIYHEVEFCATATKFSSELQILVLVLNLQLMHISISFNQKI